MLAQISAAPSLPRTRIFAILAFLVGVNVIAWILTWGASHAYPHSRLLWIGWLAFGLGLRHAVDADHISAIDNTTRKLIQDGKKPVGVGFFFSLGHSTVVVLLSALVAISASYVEHHLPAWKDLGTIIGTIVSGLFLYIIAAINLIVFFDLFRHLKSAKQDPHSDDDSVDHTLNQRGILAKLFRPILRTIQHSWQMYFVGFLFGLGFDTATSVGLLSMSAHSGQVGIPFWVIMLLPLLFTAGMCLIDTIDGILMLGAYGWAFIKPVNKLYYNLTITLLSVLVAVVVGTYELAGIIKDRLALSGGFWVYFNRINFDYLGFFIIGLFAFGWGISALVYKMRNYEPN